MGPLDGGDKLFGNLEEGNGEDNSDVRVSHHHKFRPKGFGETLGSGIPTQMDHSNRIGSGNPTIACLNGGDTTRDIGLGKEAVEGVYADSSDGDDDGSDAGCCRNGGGGRR